MADLQTFDPAFAAAPPDTDAMRALFEGLTDYDPRTLAPVPAVATRWESSDDGRVWTFHLRENARWSNGEKVTAEGFVRSGKHATLKIGPCAARSCLPISKVQAPPPNQRRLYTSALAQSTNTLQVTLQHADNSFPALVAHPVFRPVKVPDADQTNRLGSRDLISNGAFLLSATETDKVELRRAKTYWDDASVALPDASLL